MSVVEYIVNDGLKEFIKEVQTIFKKQLEDTSVLKTERCYESILETQYYIRQYLIEHQHRITFSRKNFKLQDKACRSMPSLFGLYLMVISNVDKVFDVNDALDQIESKKFTHLGVEIDTGMEVESIVFFETELHDDKVCCCSHNCRLENMGIIGNSMTNYNAVIGCDCILKHKLIDRDVYNNEKKKTRKELMKKKKRDEIKQKLLEEKLKCEEEKTERIRQEENIKIQEREREQKMRDSHKKNEPIYLVVSYEKSSIDEVKRLGGKWNPDKGPYGLWYIPPNWKYTSELLDKYKVFVIKKKM